MRKKEVLALQPCLEIHTIKNTPLAYWCHAAYQNNLSDHSLIKLCVNIRVDWLGGLLNFFFFFFFFVYCRTKTPSLDSVNRECAGGGAEHARPLRCNMQWVDWHQTKTGWSEGQKNRHNFAITNNFSQRFTAKKKKKKKKNIGKVQTWCWV